MFQQEKILLPQASDIFKFTMRTVHHLFLGKL
jgi:hypothetical protein